jgi:hypothetical protein
VEITDYRAVNFMTGFNDGREKYETLMAAARPRSRGHVGGIELVLSKILFR